MNKFIALLLLSICSILSVSGSIIDEGTFFRRLEQSTPTSRASPPPPSVRVSAPPPPMMSRMTPPPMRMFAPPPTQVTNRAALYNRPIELAPGEFLTYRPNNMFTLTGAPPSITPQILSSLTGSAPIQAVGPAGMSILSAVGPAINKVAPDQKQSFLNLIAPEVKSIPAVSSVAQTQGLQTSPQTSSSSSSSSSSMSPKSGAFNNFQKSAGLISLLVAIVCYLF